MNAPPHMDRRGGGADEHHKGTSTPYQPALPHRLINPAVPPAVTAIWLASQIRLVVSNLAYLLNCDRSDEVREWYAEEGVS